MDFFKKRKKNRLVKQVASRADLQRLVDKGLNHRELGNTIEALECFKEAAEQGYSHALLHVGTTIMVMGEHDHALTVFHSLLDNMSEYHDISWSDVYANIGAIHWLKSDYETAIPFYEKAIESCREEFPELYKNPPMSIAYVKYSSQLITCLIKAHEDQRASEVAFELLKVEPNNELANEVFRLQRFLLNCNGGLGGVVRDGKVIMTETSDNLTVMHWVLWHVADQLVETYFSEISKWCGVSSERPTELHKKYLVDAGLHFMATPQNWADLPQEFKESMLLITKDVPTEKIPPLPKPLDSKMAQIFIDVYKAASELI